MQPLPPSLQQAWQSRGIFPLRPGELIVAAELLAQAFAQDPLMVQLLPHARRQGAFRQFYLLQLRALLRAGVVMVARQEHRVQAVFAFLPPERKVTLWDEVLAGEAAMLPLLGRQLPAALEAQSRAAELRQRYAPQAWYVALVAVSPSAQGQGWLRRGLEPLLEHAQRQGREMYLETQNPRNVAIYERLGFRQLGSAPLTRLDGVQHHSLLASASATQAAAER